MGMSGVSECKRFVHRAQRYQRDLDPQRAAGVGLGGGGAAVRAGGAVDSARFSPPQRLNRGQLAPNRSESSWR